MKKIITLLLIILTVSIVACKPAAKQDVITKTAAATEPAVNSIAKDLGNLDSIDRDLNIDELDKDLSSGLIDVDKI